MTERRDEAKDNGYHFFKYMRTEHKDIACYYAIDKSSPHIERLKPLGNIIYFNSLKHYVYSICAKYLIGAFIPVGIADSICLYKFPSVCKGKKIFLQHGITKEDLPFLHQDKTNIDLFICGAKHEYDFISENFGYKEDGVSYTSFSRYTLYY